MQTPKSLSTPRPQRIARAPLSARAAFCAFSAFCAFWVSSALVLASAAAQAQPAAEAAPAVTPAAPPAGPLEKAGDKVKQAKKLNTDGSYDEALVVIEAGLGLSPKRQELHQLLDLKGDVLLKLREYAGAEAAYRALIEAGATGRLLAKAKEMVKKLVILQATKLEVAVAKGNASIYLKSKADGVFCTAAPLCNKALLPGGYAVIVEAPGFEPWTGRVTVAQGATAKLAVTLVEKPSRLTVRATPTDAVITVDGSPYAAEAELPPGAHEVAVTLGGYLTSTTEVTAREGLPVELDVALVAVAPPPPPPAEAAPRAASSGFLTKRRTVALMVAGVGLISAGAGVGLGLSSQTLEDSSYEVCPMPESCRDVARAEDYHDRAETRALQANIAFGVAGAAAVTAVVLWITGKPEEQPQVSITPRFGAGAQATTGLDLSLRF